MIYCKVCVLLTENVRNRTLITVLKSVWFDFLFQRDILMQLLQLRWDALRIQYTWHHRTAQSRVERFIPFWQILKLDILLPIVIETYPGQAIGSSNLRFEVWSLVARTHSYSKFLLFFCKFKPFTSKSIPRKEN